MLDAKRIALINAMSVEEMNSELNKGRFSRFNEESRALMTSRIAELVASKLEAVETRTMTDTATGHALTREGIRWNKWMAVVTLVGIVVAAAAYLKG